MAESSEELRAPARESSPPATHTAKTAPTVPRCWIMVLGTRKIPLPITVPTTMDAAAQGPRARFSSVRGRFSMGGLFLGIGMTGGQIRQATSGWFADAGRLHRERRRRALEERGEQADSERGNGTYQYVPRPGDRRVEMDTEHDGEAGSYAGDGGSFARLAGEHAEQEDAEQRAHGNGSDGEAGLEDGFRMARPDGDGH